ncbi:MAG: hypothetical protein WB611_22930 [Stellaceae bacterium]
MILVLFVLLINVGAFRRPLLVTFLFAVTLAVGLTPELFCPPAVLPSAATTVIFSATSLRLGLGTVGLTGSLPS